MEPFRAGAQSSSSNHMVHLVRSTYCSAPYHTNVTTVELCMSWILAFGVGVVD